MTLYAEIALPIPGDASVLDYLVPDKLAAVLQPGMRVVVPLGRRKVTGFCIKIKEESRVETSKIKPILAATDTVPVMSTHLLEFTDWWASYYHCSLGEALEASVPAAAGNEAKAARRLLVSLNPQENLAATIADLEKRTPQQSRVLRFLQESGEPSGKEALCRKLKISTAPLTALANKGLIRFVPQSTMEDPVGNRPAKPQADWPVLTLEQAKILERLQPLIAAKKFQTLLLFGVTGSGKTEVYIRAIEAVVAQGREAIVLVPEIALTPQTVMRFKERFAQVAVLHSGLTPAQRARQWGEIHAGRIQVIIGARSALFAPTRRLGLIVVDEEHEPTFKQQNTPRYHARDLAVKRAQLEQAVVILGSATPSLESYQNALNGKYELHRLPSRIGDARLPNCLVVDMKDEFRIARKFVYFSRILLEEIGKALAAQEQIILFLNRRGFATVILCPVCGYHARCPHCDIHLTYHQQGQKIACHYCGYEERSPHRCPACQFEGIRMNGAGTERIEAILRKSFPQARIMRMDSDTMTTRKRYEETFMAFSQGQADILLGTQMIAKGLDFPKVTLVGVVTADTSLQMPDFRSAERTFQLIVQVAGRAGRGHKPGKVVVQTFYPDNYAIAAALSQDYEKFARHELGLRQELGYPPFGRLVRVVADGEDEIKVSNKARELGALLSKAIPPGGWQLLGPAATPIAKIGDRYRWHLIIKSPQLGILQQTADLLAPFVCGNGAVRVQLDQDPVSLL